MPKEKKEQPLPILLTVMSALSMAPPLAPLSGFLGGAYTGWTSSEKDPLQKRMLKTVTSILLGTAAGIVAMFVPPIISSSIVSFSFSAFKCGADIVDDRKKKSIGALGYIKRIGAAMLGSIPIIGPSIALKRLDKERKQHAEKYSGTGARSNSTHASVNLKTTHSAVAPCHTPRQSKSPEVRLRD